MHALWSHDQKTALWLVEVCTKTAPSRENPLNHSESKETQVNMAAEAVWVFEIVKYLNENV